MGNPIKALGKGIAIGFKEAGKGVWKGLKFAMRPEVIGVVQVAGMVVPGVNLAVVARFLAMAKTANEMFPQKGSGHERLAWVLSQTQTFGRELEKVGVPKQEWLNYLELAVKRMRGDAKLIDRDGRELTDHELEQLGSLFEAA